MCATLSDWLFFGACGMRPEGLLHHVRLARMLPPGRGTSRKERGHRGVRPRHPEARAPFGCDLRGGFLARLASASDLFNPAAISLRRFRDRLSCRVGQMPAPCAGQQPGGEDPAEAAEQVILPGDTRLGHEVPCERPAE